jgi:hypothetical protein
MVDGLTNLLFVWLPSVEHMGILLSQRLFPPMSPAAESNVVLGGPVIKSTDLKHMFAFADFTPVGLNISKSDEKVLVRQRDKELCANWCCVVCPMACPSRTFCPTLLGQ